MNHLAETPIDIDIAKEMVQAPIVPDVVEPLVDDARRELNRLAPRLPPVDRNVIDDLVDHYRQILARVTNPVLVQRFTSFHVVNNPLWRPRAAPPGLSPDGGPRGMLDAYIRWEEIERVLAPDGPYPELAALLATVRQNWLNSSSELLDRVHDHRADIAGLLRLPVESLGKLTGVQFGISDPHNCGRTVAILDFDGHQVVYKPRPLQAELAWNALMSRVGEAVDGQAPYLPAIASIADYGFMEFVSHCDCEDEAAVERCYRRYGILTAVAHAVGACDLHHENVLVTGEYPVVIDCEPLFRARLATSPFGGRRLKIEQNLSLAELDVRESVLELGLLPTVMQVTLPAERAGGLEAMQEVEIGALCAYAAAPLMDMLPCALGTDNLQLRPYRVAAARFPNLPRLRGEPRHPRLYVEQIVSGFCAAHDYLRCMKAELTAAGGMLDSFSSCPIRMLARPTMDYMNVLSRSFSPEVLRASGARRKLIANDLRDVGRYRMDTVADLVPEEVENILNGDIPYFMMESSGTSCQGARLFTSPIESAKARLNGMDELDRVMQVTQIREQLLRRDEAIARSRPASLDRAAICAHAFAIVDGLASAAIDFEGAPCWIYASYAPGFSATMAHMDREALYEGAAGTALVVAEAGKLAGRSDWTQLAIRVFDPVLRPGKSQSALRGGGLARGLGGLVYALVRIARASGQDRLLHAAMGLVREHGARLAAAGELDEVLYGRAGFLLALLALYRHLPDKMILETADRAAAILLERASVMEAQAFWPTAGSRQMPHPSHGASGIAMALARWAALRGDPRAAQIAVKALHHDDGFWVDAENGWADGRFFDLALPERTNWSWCNGRSGAILARLAVAEALGMRFGSERVERALSAGSSDVLRDVSPGLCCGTAGAVDSLLAVCARHKHEQLQARVVTAVELMATKSPGSHYSMLAGSLFSGTAGLAFALLRAAAPEDVESVLWFA